MFDNCCIEDWQPLHVVARGVRPMSAPRARFAADSRRWSFILLMAGYWLLGLKLYYQL